MEEEREADLFVAFGPTLMWGAGMYASKKGAKPVVACINNYTPGMGHSVPQRFLHRARWYVWERLLGVRYARHIRLAFFDSPIILEEYRRFGYRFRETVVLPAPVERRSEPTGTRPFPAGADRFNILFIARLIREKGPDILVDAMAGLPENIHAHLIGAGSEEVTLRALIRARGLESRVHLYGRKTREELPAFYRHADIFVHPCRWIEPFGIVVAEALRFGLPIVVCEGTGAAWAAADAGITFPKEDVAALRARILSLYNDPAAREAYAKRARERAHLFDADNIGARFVSTLEKISLTGGA